MKRTHFATATRELTVFALLGTLLFVGDLLLEGVPNVHPVSALVAAYTLVYRWRALIPLYVYILMIGVSWGFSPFWLPYLYVWLPLVLLVMLIPRRAPLWLKGGLSVAACALHGLAFGILWAPAQMLLYRWTWEATLTWISFGLPYDALHAVGNAVAALTVLPIATLLARLEGMSLAK